MRARELLLEYNRQLTARNSGEGILKALSLHVPDRLPYYVRDYALLSRAARNPDSVRHSYTIQTPNGEIPITRYNVRDVYEAEKQSMIEHTLMAIEEHDPTPNKEYTPWLVRKFIQDPTVSVEDGRIGIEDYNRANILYIYDVAKKRNMLRTEHRDINRLGTYKQFEQLMRDSYDLDAIFNTTEVGRGLTKLVYKDNTLAVYIPLDAAGARSLAKGTVWCTQSENQYKIYSSQGPLYVLLPQQPKYENEKYQIHLPSNQYMDPNDDPTDVDTLVNRFPNFFAWLRENDEEAIKEVLFIDSETLQNIWKAIAAMAIKLYKEASYNIATNSDNESDYIFTLIDAGAVDEESKIDYDKVKKLNLEFWKLDDGMKADIASITHVSQYSASKIKKKMYDMYEEYGRYDDSYTSINELPSAFYFDMSMELNYQELSDIFESIRVYATRHRRPNNFKSVMTIAEYDIGYVS